MAHRVPADVRDTFMRHDRSRSGRLDYRELRNTLEALSLDCTTSHAADLLKRYDADGNGLLDLDEFYTMVRELREWQWSTCPPDVRAKFLEFDKDRNGRLDYGELRNALQAHAAASCSSTRLRASVHPRCFALSAHSHLQALGLDTSRQHAASLLARYDKDRSGALLLYPRRNPLLPL